MKRILITGGAGFIGAHLARELLAHGYAVRALDNLSPQVHGEGAREAQRRPAYLDGAVELQVGDVRDAAAAGPAYLDGAFELQVGDVRDAAAVGAPSMASTPCFTWRPSSASARACTR